jgi:hypothetical protein
LRLADGRSRTALAAVAELGVYVLVTLAATWAFERELLSEVLGYMRPGRRPLHADVVVA